MDDSYNKERVLVVVAHPDDETLGCGATLRYFADKGDDIMLITLTDGVGARGDEMAENRNNRLDKVCEILGISRWVSGDYPDNRMDSVPLLDVVKFIEVQLISFNFRPTVVLTHHPGCLNIDHALTYRATLTALRPQNGEKMSFYSFMIPSSTDYNPLATFNGNVYFRLNVDQVDAKMNVLSTVYDDEMRDFPHSRSYRNVVNLMRVWGAEIGTEYAEKFQLIREIK